MLQNKNNYRIAGGRRGLVTILLLVLLVFFLLLVFAFMLFIFMFFILVFFVLIFIFVFFVLIFILRMTLKESKISYSIKQRTVRSISAMHTRISYLNRKLERDISNSLFLYLNNYMAILSSFKCTLDGLVSDINLKP